MIQKLKKTGIDRLDNFLYEFAPIDLPWWDKDHLTTLEVEARTHEDKQDCSICIVFCPEAEGVLERTIVFYAAFNDRELTETTLIDKDVLEHLQDDIQLEFSENQNAYFTDDFNETKSVLSHIFHLVKDQKTVERYPLEEGDGELKAGDVLDHFIGMIHINSAEFTKESIAEHLKTGIEYEGQEYLEALQEDIKNGIVANFQDEYAVELEKPALDLIIEVVNEYK
ncbi:hypothetical protein [Microscilla marina]|uniref:Uncharacterized protein n=1 Tax=Microscilla marina ATCC 23134 TaxID=313606 RepID=A1ZSJ9_MICM2|nr:hypothetical protein [Microscilla marina]EAY26579.1 hypothetical protein M23134_06106 [Microscilla marina ATCC 23134]